MKDYPLRFQGQCEFEDFLEQERTVSIPFYVSLSPSFLSHSFSYLFRRSRRSSTIFCDKRMDRSERNRRLETSSRLDFYLNYLIRF